MKISIHNSQKDLTFSKGSAKALVEQVLAFMKVNCDEVAIYFVTKKKISLLHDQFFQDPTPTDCISFPLDEKHLGEVFVCPKVAIEYGRKHQIDPLKETALYTIHGLLHLIGYDDLEPKAKRLMRKKEKSCMRHLERVNVHLR